MNPKAACLKRREEEKTDELPGRALNSEDMASQAHLGSKVSNSHQPSYMAVSVLDNAHLMNVYTPQ